MSPGDQRPDASLLGQIVDDFTDRCHRGDVMSADEYVRQHPALADVLRQVLPAIQVLAQRTAPVPAASSQQISQDLSELRPHFPHYELLSELGRGGMGVIYRAWHRQLHRDVAIKIVRRDRQFSTTVIERFRAESRAIAMLQHPHIVQIHEVGEFDGTPFLVLEYCGGGSLANRDSLLHTPAEAARLTWTIAQAVHAAHSAGLVHRDLKPANILMTTTGIVKVTDFGLVKSVNQDSGQTESGAIMGTPSYMSPEQTQGDTRLITTATDIYAIGAILYDLLTGRPPFQAASAIQTMEMVRQHAPVKPSQLNTAVPYDLETICLKCLRKDVGDRYSSAAALADDLHAFLHHRPIRARRVSYLDRSVKFARRSPLFATVLLLLPLTVALAAIVAARIHQQGEEQMRLAEADGAAAALLNADILQLPALLADWQKPARHYESALRRLVHESGFSPDSPRRLNAALALLTSDPSQLAIIRQQLPYASAEQLDVMGEAAARSPNELTRHCEEVLSSEIHAAGHRFRTACLLARLHLTSAAWSDERHCQLIAQQLVASNPSELGSWRKLLLPVMERLEPALDSIRSASDSSMQSQLFAVDLLAEHHSQNVTELINLLIDATPEQFAIVLPKLSARRSEAVGHAGEFLHRHLPVSAETADTTLEQIARTAALLVHLQADDQIWSLFRRQKDPRLMSFLIHSFPQLAVPAPVIWKNICSHPHHESRYGLLLCLGGYPSQNFPDTEIQKIVEQLLTWYRSEPDPGVHSAVAFVLHRWGHALQEREHRQHLSQTPPNHSPSHGDQRWFVNSQQQTYVIVDADSFLMGSPETLAGRDPDEQLHVRRVNRRFAIAAREVTLSDLLRFQPNDTVLQDASTEPEHPAGMVSWYTAAAYCNWLSQQEGIPADEWCYEPNSSGEYAAGMRAVDSFLQRTGYRLPTEAEWEFACRAMTITSRYYGDSDALLAEYAWFSPVARDRRQLVAQLRPNPFGLFDVLGNQYEWCHETYHPYGSDKSADQPLTLDDDVDCRPVSDTDRRVVRGGSFDHSARHSRSSYRTNDLAMDQILNNGIRPARTLKP